MSRTTRKTRVTLWIIQGLLAALFLFAGGMKLVASPELLKGPVALPIGFLRFIGVAEFAGAIGLVLPGLLRIKPFLTSLAALGLVIIMAGATVISFMAGPAASASIPAVVGILAAVVGYGRWKVAPFAQRSPKPELQLAA